jgi:hypothetical protein
MSLFRVVLSDVLGGKDVVERRDGRTDGWTCWIVIRCICVKMELHPQIRFYFLPLIILQHWGGGYSILGIALYTRGPVFFVP